MKKKIVIIGGVAGGATAATRLRRLDEEIEIIIFERGEYVSFANCGLPYYIGETIEDRESLFIAKPPLFKSRYNIDVRILSEVISINRQEKTLLIRNLKTGEKYEESYDKLLISTGSKPFVPNMDFDNAENVFTLWTVNDADRIKKYIKDNDVKSAVIAGGGFIGLEMSENLRDLGIDLTLVEFGNQLMPPLDYDMSQYVLEELRYNGVKVELGVGVSGFKNKGKTVVLSDGRELQTDMTLLSIGVRPNGELAAECGLEVNQKGGIIVDDYMMTSDENIFAVGDVVEITNPINNEKAMIALAGPANKQGRLVGANILGLDKKEKYTGTMGASIAKVFNLEVGCVGETEKSLNRRGLIYGKDYDYSIIHSNDHVGYYPGACKLSVKLLFSLENGEVFGAQVIGNNNVSKRIDVISTLIHFHGTVYDLSTLELSYAPPFNGPKDPVNIAGYVACDILDGLTHQLSWKDIKDSDEYTLLDVRYPGEILFTRKFDNAVEIPIDQLRDRYNELDKNKKYAIFCAVGLRGYVAERILREYGFDVYNIKGGLRTMECYEK